MYFGSFKDDKFNGYGILAKGLLKETEFKKTEENLLSESVIDPDRQIKDNSFREIVQKTEESQQKLHKRFCKEWEYYFGEFLDGKCHGFGTEVRKQFTYEGEYITGKRLNGKFTTS